jgi:hypothetical protein
VQYNYTELNLNKQIEIQNDVNTKLILLMTISLADSIEVKCLLNACAVWNYLKEIYKPSEETKAFLRLLNRFEKGNMSNVAHSKLQ